jgi:aspartate aminotransferase
LNFAISTLCDDGDEIIIPEPYYANYNGFHKPIMYMSFLFRHLLIPVCIPPIEEFEKKSPKKPERLSSVIPEILPVIFILAKS